MSLTDSDMARLKETADMIASKRQRGIAAPAFMTEKIEGSYYEKRVDSSMDAVLCMYDFKTPMELKDILQKVWGEMGEKEMEDFIPVSMVALAKRKPEQGMQKVEQQVSQYIYEF